MLGVGKARITFRYVLPSVVGPVFRHACLRLPGITLALATLGFLGLGPQPPASDWGLVLAVSLSSLNFDLRRTKRMRAADDADTRPLADKERQMA